MKIGRLFQISLATKCQLLFGIAVIVIIVAALLVPWIFMGSLVDELNVNVAKQAALAVQARYRLETQDWKSVQVDLSETWPYFSRELGLTDSVPRLIYVGDCSGPPREEWDEFERVSIEQLCSNPQRSETQRIEHLAGRGRITRYGLAIRSSMFAEPTGRLRGIISVTMAAQQMELYYLYQTVMMGAGVVAGLLAIAVFYVITQYLILSPVRDLEEVARRIVSGETNLRAETNTGDEFEELGQAFNEMLSHLNTSQEELRKVNKSLDTKLGGLAEANVALFEANRLKGEFLGNVSHELRTPLNSIIGFAELLRDASEVPDQVDPQKVKRFCNNILISGRMLLDIINDLLDLAKIEAGKMTVHRTTFPLTDICEAVIDFTKPMVDKKGLDVAASISDDLPVMQSDAGKIQQIFYNLMSNALKFTPKGGRVDVLVRTDGDDHILLAVKDTGPGIPAEMHEQIFEKFRQLDGSVTREFGGTGLGLAISRDLATMLGGSISLRSEEGQGAEFRVRLPVQCPEKVELPPIRLS